MLQWEDVAEKMQSNITMFSPQSLIAEHVGKYA